MPVFSPDGKWIAFICDEYIDLLAIKGGPSRHLVKGVNGGLAWSVHSQRVIFIPQQYTGLS